MLAVCCMSLCGVCQILYNIICACPLLQVNFSFVLFKVSIVFSCYEHIQNILNFKLITIDMRVHKTCYYIFLTKQRYLYYDSLIW